MDLPPPNNIALALKMFCKSMNVLSRMQEHLMDDFELLQLPPFLIKAVNKRTSS